MSATKIEGEIEGATSREQGSSLKTPTYRIVYALGPGDVAALYRSLMEDRKPAFALGMAFSKQFLDWCDEIGAVARAMSHHPRRDYLRAGPHIIENRPKPSLSRLGGVLYHLGAILYGLTVVRLALRDRATHVFVDAGTTHWIVLSLLSLVRIPVIAVFHGTFWPMGFPPRRLKERLLLKLDGWFFRHLAAATICVSPECERQVRAVAGKPKGAIYQCRPQYRQGFLSGVEPATGYGTGPFNVLFLGRLEEDKGVFLILSIAERLQQEMRDHFRWRIIGSGSAFEYLKREVEERNLNSIVDILDKLPNDEKALEVLGWCHAMVVPTTSRFCEGLAMTAAESVLAGRPVVVSATVPAWEILGDAAVKAETDNIESFVQAFKKLALNPSFYQSSQGATRAAQAQFYDRSQGLGAVCGRALAGLD